MKRGMFGLLVLALLTGPMAANAAYLYTFSDSASAPTASLSFTVSDFVTETGMLPFAPQTINGFTFNQAALRVCSGNASFDFVTGSISNLIDCDLNATGAFIQSNFTGVPQALGSFSAGGGQASGGLPFLGFLTITVTGTEIVPEPGTLALLGLGLAGLGLGRRRKAS